MLFDLGVESGLARAPWVRSTVPGPEIRQPSALNVPGRVEYAAGQPGDGEGAEPRARAHDQPLPLVQLAAEGRQVPELVPLFPLALPIADADHGLHLVMRMVEEPDLFDWSEAKLSRTLLAFSNLEVSQQKQTQQTTYIQARVQPHVGSHQCVLLQPWTPGPVLVKRCSPECQAVLQ